MRKTYRLVAIGICAIILACLSLKSHARITGTNPTGASADVFCVGPANSEVCVNSNGDVIPTLNNDAALGSSSLGWSSATIVGNLSAGALTLSNGGSVSQSAGAVFTSSGSVVIQSTTSAGTNPVLKVNNTASAGLLTVNQNGTVGLGAAPSATAELNVLAANASSTGAVINTAASPTADALEVQINGTNAVRVGPQGHVQYKQRTKAQADAEVPDFSGAHITITNYGLGPLSVQFVDCIATGTAIDQWMVINSTGGTGASGCGVGK